MHEFCDIFVWLLVWLQNDHVCRLFEPPHVLICLGGFKVAIGFC